MPPSGEETFEKHGAYLEIERSMSEAVTLLVRADGLYRAGNLPASSPLAPRAAVFRYTAAGAFTLAPGFRLTEALEALRCRRRSNLFARKAHSCDRFEYRPP
mgnify:CR=1 FL=1